MSNRVTIMRTVFTDYATKEASYGYRIYDDYANDYNNCLIEDDLKLGDAEFLREAQGRFEPSAAAIFDFALEIGRISIDNRNYEIVLDDKDWKLVE
jgi:hypothetical protein